MSEISRALLKWYDANARDLPWRVGPAARKVGARPDPYRVWLSEIMLQQTTVATVSTRFDEFIRHWPDVGAMARASADEVLAQWAGLGYYARARNLHKCAVEVAARGGFPETEDELRNLPGVGDYTAAAIAAIAFDARAIVIDGNIERVAARIFSIATPLPKAKVEIRAALEGCWPKKRSGDFAQALMDLGAMICTPRRPDCGACPLARFCVARAEGIAEQLPVRPKKPLRSLRQGVVFALVNGNGEMLFERRPEKGLLGGMLGLPGSEWSTGTTTTNAAAPAIANWRKAGVVAHTFTHFHLDLDVMTAPAPKAFRAGPEQQWIAPERARLPTVMKKAALLAADDPSKKKEKIA